MAQRFAPLQLPTGFVPPSIARAADGTVIAAGPSRSGSVVRIGPNLEAEWERVSLIGRLIISVHHHPDLGLSAMSTAGTLYRRSDDGNLLPEWVPVRTCAEERGVLAWTVLDGTPAALLFDEAQAPGSSARGRVWLSLLTEGRVCDGEPSPLPPVYQTFAGHPVTWPPSQPKTDARSGWFASPTIASATRS